LILTVNLSNSPDFVNLVSAYTGTTFEKSEYIGSYSNGESIPFFQIKFTSSNEMDAASIYTHSRKVFANYFYGFLDMDVLLSLKTLNIFLFEDDSHFETDSGGLALAHAGQFYLYEYGGFERCFDENLCHISMSDAVVPSGSSSKYWKDVLVHEIVHITQYVEGGRRFDQSLSEYWFTENFANIMAEIVNTDLGETMGVSSSSFGTDKYYASNGCGDLESPYDGWMYGMWGYTGYVAPDPNNSYTIYCALGYIMWDFYDYDEFNPYNNGNFYGWTVLLPGDERDWNPSVHLSGKIIWDAFASNQNIYSLTDVYNVFTSLVGSTQTERIFEMHGVPGGQLQI